VLQNLESVHASLMHVVHCLQMNDWILITGVLSFPSQEGMPRSIWFSIKKSEIFPFTWSIKFPLLRGD
jgi:hypothetical protein